MTGDEFKQWLTEVNWNFIIPLLVLAGIIILVANSCVNTYLKDNPTDVAVSRSLSPNMDYVKPEDEDSRRSFDDKLHDPNYTLKTGDIRLDPTLNKANVATINRQKGLTEFTWSYNNQKFTVALFLDPHLNNVYQSIDRPIKSNQPDDFSDYLNKVSPYDTVVHSLAGQIKAWSETNKFSNDQLAELAMAFVQQIPYDHDRANDLKNLKYLTPFQVLFRNQGICLDKSLLAVNLFRELGFGCALFAYPDLPKSAVGHAAVGLQCPAADGLYNGYNYCYGETTGLDPIGIVPQFKDGQLIKSYLPNNTGDAASLGKPQISLESQGLIYHGLAKLKTAKRTV